MFVTFIKIFVYSYRLFFLIFHCQVFHCVNILIHHSPLIPMMGSFYGSYFWALVKNTAMNILVHIFWWTGFHFGGGDWGAEGLGHDLHRCSALVNTSSFPTVGQFSFSSSWEFQLCYILTTAVIFYLSHFSHSSEYVENTIIIIWKFR